MSNLKKEEQFSRAFKSYGNRLVAENNHSIDQFRIDCQKAFSKYTHLDIYIDIIDNSMVNAVARKFEDSYFIGIFKGTINILDYYSRKFTSHPNILFDFGSANQENNRTKLYNSIIKNDIHIIDEDPPILPITESRRQLRNLVFSQSILNIVFHELGHIVNGHIDLLKLSHTHSLEEIQMEQTKLTSMESLNRQTLEIDADAFSASETFLEILKVYDSKNDAYREILPNLRSVFKLWSFVRQMCWKIMENDYIGKDLLKITHPPTNLRFRYTRIAGLYIVKERGDADLIDNFEISFSLGVAQADEAFKILCEKETSPLTISKELSNYHFSHGLLIFCHWDFIRESLLPFASYPLRNPNICDDQYNEILKNYKQVISKLN
jgi:hypothetical protein